MRRLLIMAVCVPPLFGQWITSGGTIYYNGGDVGIGTASPTTLLHLKGSNIPYRGQLSLEAPDFAQVSFYGGPSTSKSRIWYDVAADQMNFYNDVQGAPFIFRGGNVSIGTAAASSAPLLVVSTSKAIRTNYWMDFNASQCGLGSVGQNVYLDNTSSSFKWSNTHPTIGGSAILFGTCNATAWNDIVFFRAAGTTGNIPTTADGAAAMVETMRISSTGNVGIGTSNPAHLLHVAGAIGAEEVIVSSTGADYVFDPDYHLTSLPQVAAYIEANHHLPEIPSEAEMRDKGLGVGQLETKLLAKVEELTLHLIAEHEKVEQLVKDNARLRDEFTALQEKVSR